MSEFNDDIARAVEKMREELREELRKELQEELRKELQEMFAAEKKKMKEKIEERRERREERKRRRKEIMDNADAEEARIGERIAELRQESALIKARSDVLRSLIAQSIQPRDATAEVRHGDQTIKELPRKDEEETPEKKSKDAQQGQAVGKKRKIADL